MSFLSSFFESVLPTAYAEEAQDAPAEVSTKDDTSKDTTEPEAEDEAADEPEEEEEEEEEPEDVSVTSERVVSPSAFKHQRDTTRSKYSVRYATDTDTLLAYD